MSRIILHIDLNAFFVRCEEIRKPSLEGKAIIIGHEGRCGIVSTCSYAARKYGIHSGMPTFKAVQLYPDVLIIHGDYDYYQKMSHKFFDFIKKYAKTIEIASVDECFVDMTNELKGVKDVLGYLKEMQNSLFKETGLKCSIGVAPTKFLAKMGSDMKKPMGITIIRRKDVRKMLDPLPIGDFFGIGKKTAPRLIEKGIKTIGDLAKLVNGDEDTAKGELGKFYYVIKDWINGYGSDIVDNGPFDPKSIGNSETFMNDTNNYDEIKNRLLKIAKEVSQRAKEADKVGSTTQIVMKDNNFKVINRSKSLKKPTNDYEIISSEVLALLDKNYDEDRMIRLVGVTLQNLVDPTEAVVQLSIFDNYDEIKEECATKLLVAELNRKMKKNVFKTAAEQLKEKKNATR